jgi:hypothetical protein
LLADLDLSKPIVIRLLSVDHPFLPSLPPTELHRFLKLAEANAQEYLRVTVRIQPEGKMPLEELFRRHLSHSDSHPLGRRIIPPESRGAREVIMQSLERSHTNDDPDVLVEMIVGHPVFRSGANPLERDEVLARAADYQAQVLRSLHTQNIAEGQPLVKNPLFAQAMAWERLASLQDRSEVLLTPHLIASAESGATLPVALRGGVNAGLVAPNPGPLQGAIVFSTYPFLGTDRVLLSLRGDPPEDPASVMALYLVHELGHLLRRWGHDWRHPEGCLMRPCCSLDYEAWYHRVRAHGPCQLSHPRMKTF